MRKLFISLALVLGLGLTSGAQDKVVKTVMELGRTDNRTMEHNDFLSNVIGGRIVGSHNLEDAEKWVESRFKEWGLEVEVQEVGQIKVGFSRGPWSGRMIGDQSLELHFGTPAYTAGTRGVQKGHVLLEPKTQRAFDNCKGALKGAWVLIDGKTNGMALDSTPAADSTRAAKREAGEEVIAPFYREMVEAGVLGFIRSGELPLQVLYDRANCYNLTMETLPKVCDIILDSRQFELIKSKVQAKDDFQLEFSIRNNFFEGPVKYHNIIGKIKGSKYPDEYVILGGHLDSYDVATGSVDDGNGVALTMEAARLLSAAGAKPKRSILFCIWTGEEYGLLGSRYFVENKTVPLDKISNYFNRDGGPLASTALNVPEAMYEDFVKVAAPILDYDPEMPVSVNKRKTEPQPRPTKAGGSDHAYFAMNGVPTISFSETDPLGYNFNYRTIWHTDMDRSNQVIPEYMNHSTVVTAVVAYGLANLDHLLSREGLYSN